MALNIGLDLCDDYITAYEYEDKSMISVPAVICREKKDDLWYIGEGAYRMALSGKGVLTDKLLSLLKKGGTFLITNESDGLDKTAQTFQKIIDGMNLYTAEEIEAALKAAGFSKVTYTHHKKNPWIAIVATK